tara:strand:- start:293 stop:523 length:231 start_codon:yes stop_codon:yes gene_type:complete
METLIVTLTISTVVSLLSLLVGGVIGWMARTYTLEKVQFSQYPSHPEMYDENGNLIADEIVAFRFENAPDDNQDDS